MKKYRSEKIGKNIIRTYDELLKLWDTDIKEIDLISSYGTTHVITCTDESKPPLVLFHGVGDDSALMWIYNARFLSEHFSIYAVDTIGGPGKSVPGELYNKEFKDEDWIDSVLDDLGLEKAYFIGVSHGGNLVQRYAALRSDRVIKGIAISSILSVGSGGKSSSMAAMMKVFMPEALFPTPKNVEKLIKKLSGSNFTAFTENSTIMEHYSYLLKGFNNMAMAYHTVRQFSESEADIICNKVEFLIGLEDPFYKLSEKVDFKSSLMKATYYENAGHGLNHEKAREINEKILEILSK